MDPAAPSPERPRVADVLKGLGLSGAEAKRALRSGKVSVHNVPTSDGGRLVDPQTVRFDPSAPRITVGRDVAFLHHDAHLAVIWKPAGMLAVTAPKRRTELTVLGAVRRKLGDTFVVHRLDEQTSGLMLVALTEAAQAGLKALLEERAITRRYLALVDGHPPARPWTKDTWIMRNRGDGRRGSADPEGPPPPLGAQHAVTHFRRVELLRRGAAVLEARLESGRTHQVRIHADESGHPVLGDNLYGGLRITRRAPRLALHAAWLAFKHPITGEDMDFYAPLADDLEIHRRTLNRERDSLEEHEGRAEPHEETRREAALARSARDDGDAGEPPRRARAPKPVKKPKKPKKSAKAKARKAKKATR